MRRELCKAAGVNVYGRKNAGAVAKAQQPQNWFQVTSARHYADPASHCSGVIIYADFKQKAPKPPPVSQKRRNKAAASDGLMPKATACRL